MRGAPHQKTINFSRVSSIFLPFVLRRERHSIHFEKMSCITKTYACPLLLSENRPMISAVTLIHHAMGHQTGGNILFYLGALTNITPSDVMRYISEHARPTISQRNTLLNLLNSKVPCLRDIMRSLKIFARDLSGTISFHRSKSSTICSVTLCGRINFHRQFSNPEIYSTIPALPSILLVILRVDSENLFVCFEHARKSVRDVM